MDYEKAYKEALETARKINNGDGVEAPADWTVCETIFPVLREDYDDMIRGAIIDHLKDNNLTEWADWLEKQGGQKPVDKTEPKFKVGDTIRLKKGDGLEWTVEKVFNNGYYTIFCADRDACVLLDDKWELVKQKSIDKVEPKFKVGDWIICCDYEPVQIISVRTNVNAYEMSNGDVRPFWMVDNNHNIRYWTIKDAKAGDVLADKYNNIGFFKECEGIYWDSYIYLGCDGKLRGFSIRGKHEQTDAHPATKEQRDTLEKALTDAGYEFDFETKELKKIIDEKQIKNNLQDNRFRRMFEQKSAWSEEDESRMNNICYFLEEYGNQYYEELTLKDMINWFKSLRPQNNITDEELIKARNEAYNEALDKLEYHSDTPTFNDGWSAAIWYLKKRNDTNLKEEK